MKTNNDYNTYIFKYTESDTQKLVSKCMILEHKGQAINNLILPEQLEEI
jgi:hypothetical protein